MGLNEQFNAMSTNSLSMLLEQSGNHAVFLLSSAGKVISCNKNVELVTGYSAQEMRGTDISFFFGNNTAGTDEHLKAIESAKHNGIFDCRQQFKRKDGKIIRAFVCLTALPDEQGIVNTYNISLIDLSGNTNIISEAFHLARVIERTFDAIFSTDLSFKIISWNNAAEKLYGYTAEEVIGKTLKDILRPQMSSAIFENIDNSVKQHGYWVGEAIHLRKDGVRLEIEESIATTKDVNEKVDGFVWVCRDITLLKKNERELHFLTRQIETANDAIFTASEDGFIQSWNSAAVRLYGYTSDEAIGKATEELLRPQFSTQEIKELREEIFKSGYWQGEVIHTKKDGSSLSVLATINVEKDKEGKVEKYFCICSDLTNLKRNEDILIKMEQQIAQLTQEKLDDSLKEIADYKYALDASSLVNITDANNVIKYVNKKFCEASKYTADELIGKNENILNSDFHTEAFKESLWNTISNGKIWTGQIKNKAKDGTFFWVNTTIVPFIDDSGKPYQYLEIGKDVTERRKTEEAYRKSEEIKDTILKASMDAIIGVDSNGLLITWNKQAEKMFGWKPDEVLGKSFTDVIIPERHRQRDMQIMRHYLETGQGDVFNRVLEVNVLNKEGKEFMVEFTNVPLEQDGVKYFCAFMRDISQRKKWEKELKESEQKYKMLFENNPLPMWMFTIPERRVIEVNDAAIKHYGYSREEFLRLNLLDLRPDEDKPLFLEETKKFKEGIRNAGVWRHKKKDGEIIYVEIFRDDIIYNEQPVRLVLANDVSEKFRTEKRLQESYEELRSLASHLQQIREEERAVIAREIHDELGQQITGLKMDVSWIAKRLASEDASIHQKIKNVLELLDETVKTVRKIASELRPSILDDLGLVDALQWYSLEFEKRYKIPISFQTKIDELQLSKNNAIGLFRIYQESLTNVARHAGASFVKSSISIKEAVLELTIEDNGKGFNTDHINKKKTLGLLGMKERTLMMGGTYNINSKPGNGTTVVVSVPLIPIA